MKEVFEKIFSRVQQMSDAEFKTELDRYKDDELVVALSVMEGVLARHCEQLIVKDVLWSLRSEVLSPLAVDDFEEWKAIVNAANDERFALAA